MTKKTAAEKWASIALGVVCLALVLNLLLRGGVGSGTEKPTRVPARPAAKPQSAPGPVAAKDDLSRYDPEVKLDLLSDLQERPLPSINRNPFEFPKPKPIPAAIGPQPPRPAVSAAPVALTIKLVGYSQKENGIREGIISGEDGIFIVHEGETFDKRYKVNRLTATMVEIYDETTRQTVEMPMAP
jgi:hypothetical protein